MGSLQPIRIHILPIRSLLVDKQVFAHDYDRLVGGWKYTLVRGSFAEVNGLE